MVFKSTFIKMMLGWMLAFIATLSLGQSRFNFETTPGLLSKDIRPSRYRLHLELDPASDTFSGVASIGVDVRRLSAAMVIHAHELNASHVLLISGDKAATKARTLRIQAEPSTQTWRLIPQDGRSIPSGHYVLKVTYTGSVNKSDAGLYRAPYKAQGQTKQMLATQLEAVFARKLFPAFDEPAFRSVFEISVTAPKAYSVFSNMPLRSMHEQAGQRRHYFLPTPSMPTYLVAVAVGQLDVVNGHAGRVPLRILTSQGKRAQGAYAMEVTQKILPFYNAYFGIDYALPKLDQLAVPSTRGGAMEDWGLISYAETALLFDPANSNENRRMQVFSTVAHEVAHQWFGNLVTAASWEEIWLNEAFATWMAEKTTDRFNPEWHVQLRRRQPIDHAMAEDASSATRAIRSGAVKEDRVFDVFDTITYIKGGAVLSMIEGWLGPDVFQQGLSSYMKQQRFSNATAADLWFHIGQASGRDVTSVARSWTDQKGFPLLQVDARCEGGQTLVQVAQSRFATDLHAVDTAQWSIPLIILHQGQWHRVLLSQVSQSFALPGCGEPAPIVNPGGEGFYRVQYAPAVHAALVKDFASLPPAARITLLSDSFALVQAGRAPLSAYFDLLNKLPSVRGEGRAALIDLARSGLSFLDEASAQTPAQIRLRALGRGLLAPELATLGWVPRLGDSSETQLLRNGLIRSLAQWGDESTLAHAAALFDQDDAGGSLITPEIRDAVIFAAGLGADAQRHARLVRRLMMANSEEDRWRYARAAASVSSPELAKQVLDLSLTGSLPNNISSSLPYMVSEGGVHGDLAYRFVLTHYPQLAEVAGEMFGSSSWLLPGAASGFNTLEMATQLVSDQQRLAGDKGAKSAAIVAAQIRLKAVFQARNPTME
jgi:aminopeptidase N